ncbi:hypothetical protein [Mucilaginibacter rubeus]|uniref:Uncharacterized protein n=1 Tax=Mucilaginibacter rubeus TaxID=2027860 RepID=A0A5C1I037_9SPHI|nr:hypothetical protein [Mucilaginibacter rubeus]QEM10601.1 hypothetical protein DEO27_011410 [Mucilaginibacter rubeus]
MNIKYFIYRGLKKGDFFTGDNVLPPTESSSDFIAKINAAFTAFYQGAEGGVPEFLAKYIGFDPDHQTDNLSLDSFFFKEAVIVENNGEFEEDSAGAFELPLIKMASSLGRFAEGNCGIDIVLNYGDYSLPEPNGDFVFDLAYARLAESMIMIDAQADSFASKVKREQITQFLDVAAYFGFHCIDTGSVTVYQAGASSVKKGQDIYTSVIDRFATKNRIYLYIQSDRTRSYNFYGNYLIEENGAESLKTGNMANSLTPVIYGSQGWPLLLDEGLQNHAGELNTIFLQFVTDNNPNTMFYGQVAQVDNAQGNNFCGPDDLKLPVDAEGSPIALTKVIALSNPATGADNNKLNIACFNILIYQGMTYKYVAGQVTNDQGETVDVLAQPNFFDDVFDGINATPLLKAGDDTSNSSITLQKLKLINHYYGNIQYGVSAVQTTVVSDEINTGDEATQTLNRVSYISESVDVLNNVVTISGTVTADSKSSPSVSGTVADNKAYQLPPPFYYYIKTFTDSTQTVTGLKLSSTDGTIPTKVILGLTKNENDLLKDLIKTNELINPRLFLIDLFEDGSSLISSESIQYRKYNVGIVGETGVGELRLVLNEPGGFVYSLDNRYYFSKDYSDFIKDTPITSLFLDLEISL